METFQTILAERLSEALAKAGLPDIGELTHATDPRFGDYQTNAAMVLAKQRRENPREVAAKIVAHLDVADIAETPSSGRGRIHQFPAAPAALEAKTAELIGDDRLGVARTAVSPKRIVIDFGSPNVAKPMHVGPHPQHGLGRRPGPRSPSFSGTISFGTIMSATGERSSAW